MQKNNIIAKPCAEMRYKIKERIVLVQHHDQRYLTINMNEVFDNIKIQQFVQLE